MKINKIVETCIYSFDLGRMKNFYAGVLGMPVVQEEEDKLIFLQAGKSMLLIFNPDRTSTDNDTLPTHGAATPQSSVHFAMEILEADYERWKELLMENEIAIERGQLEGQCQVAILSRSGRKLGGADIAWRVACGKLI